MRLRLFLSFTLIALVSIASLLIVIRQSAIQEVQTFMFRGGMAGLEGMVAGLENHYASNHSWVGADHLLDLAGQETGNRRGNRGGQTGFGGMMGGMMNQRIRLADAEGKLILDTGNPDPIGSLENSELQQAIPLRMDDATVGYLLPENGMVFSTGDDTALIGRLTRAANIAATVAIAFALFLAVLLSNRLLRPIRALTKAASALAEGELSKRVAVQGGDELAVLGQTFNQMAISLEEAEESRRGMTADIAHELRTPLAVQRAQLEALQDGVYPASVENITSILEQNILLTRLVDDLRTLALVDAGQLQLEMVPTDLSSLVKRILQRFKSQAGEKQIDLQYSAVGECHEIQLDPGRVEQIIGNLLTNALRYSPAHSWVKINLECSANNMVLLVHDNGPGIPIDSQEIVFNRFYRADQSRSRAEGGSGLGLAIARQLAEAQGGKLTASNHPEGGAVLKLAFSWKE
jgi:two-component system sensor histidine kinase BaeS